MRMMWTEEARTSDDPGVCAAIARFDAAFHPERAKLGMVGRAVMQFYRLRGFETAVARQRVARLRQCTTTGAHHLRLTWTQSKKLLFD
jgi:hypothetical protein